MGIYGEKKCGNFGKVLQKSSKGKFSESLTESFRGNFYGKGFMGEMGNRVWIETWKVVDPSQLQ